VAKFLTLARQRVADTERDRLKRGARQLGLRTWRDSAEEPDGCAAASTSTVTPYRDLYERHAQLLPDELSIGAGDYALMGQIMLSALVDAGLRPDHTLVDFGCGTGRLAVHAVRYLANGRYVGTDIAETMLSRARDRVAALPADTCGIRWELQDDDFGSIPDASVDMFAAFSVFTHMEHEDAFRYLRDARRAIRKGGHFVYSCLTMDLPASREVFQVSAESTLEARWGNVRNVTTSYDLMDAIATMAGWSVERWYKGDEELIPLLGSDSAKCALGQSICVLLAR
jgi:SAM-dependent methyltransferase